MTKTNKDEILAELESQGYVLTAIAAEKTNYTPRQILKLIETGRIRSKKLNKTMAAVNLKDLIQYIAAHPPKVLNTIWDEIDFCDGEAFYPLFGYDCKYFVSNKCRVINASNGQVLTPSTDKRTGYNKVFLMKNGKIKAEYLHRLVGITQCQNVLGKDIFHHIKIHKPIIDSAGNLLPVWQWQHDELHRLLKENKIKEYKEMIKTIKKENSQKLYEIPHPDFVSDENYDYCLQVTKEGYRAYKAGQDILPEYIVREYARYKKVGIEN